MNLFTFLFVFALAAFVVVRIWLARRQLHSITAHRERVPDAFRDRIPLDAHHKAADYTSARIRAGFLETLVGALFLLGWTLGGWIQLLDTAWAGSGWAPLYAGTGFLISAALIMGLLELPFELWRTFRIEQRFGFNRSTPGLFIADHLKQVALLLLIGTPLALLVLWLMQGAGPLWWFYVWLVWMGFSLLMMWAYPAFIAPMFNKFAPLDNAALRERIERLLERCGFASRGIFVMDGSRRSGHSNAYFTGLGANKRIVFFDTLMESLSAQELEAVLAHELGHFKHRHIHKNIALMAVFSLAGLALLGWLIGQPWFFNGLGVNNASTHTALLLFLIVSPVFTFFVQPLLAHFSRHHEFEADDFAAAQTDARDLIHALVKLYTENATTLTPDPVYSAFYDSHPPAAVRVAHLSTKMPEPVPGRGNTA